MRGHRPRLVLRLQPRRVPRSGLADPTPGNGAPRRWRRLTVGTTSWVVPLAGGVASKLACAAELIRLTQLQAPLPRRVVVEVDPTIPADALGAALIRSLTDARARDHRLLVGMNAVPPTGRSRRQQPTSKLVARGMGRAALAGMLAIVDRRPTVPTALAVIWRSVQDPSTSTAREEEFTDLCRKVADLLHSQGSIALSRLLRSAPNFLSGSHWRAWRDCYADAVRAAPPSVRARIRCAVALVWIAGRPATISVGPTRAGARLAQWARDIRAPRIERYSRSITRIFASGLAQGRTHRAVVAALRMFAVTVEPSRFSVVAMQALSRIYRAGRHRIDSLAPFLAAARAIAPGSPVWGNSVGLLLSEFRNLQHLDSTFATVRRRN